MSDRRKDTWKLLYTMVNRNQNNLSAVYNVVDDILCQDPSLISCSSVRELGTQFQDTFLLWLLNRLSACLTQSEDEGQCLKNVHLQQKLLASCLCNHPKLFKRLVEAYIEALQLLNDQMSAFDYNHPNNNPELRILRLHVFHCDVRVLKEFDEHCSFQVIQLQLERSDVYAKYLLLVLQQAHRIGHATHSELFAESLEQALLTLKECNLDTKLTSLGYCYSVLQALSQASWSSNADVANYAPSTLCAAILMWSMSSQWIEAECMTQAQLEQLATHTQDLLTVLEEQELPNCRSLKLSCQLLRELLHLPASDWCEDLIQTLCNYLQN